MSNSFENELGFPDEIPSESSLYKQAPKVIENLLTALPDWSKGDQFRLSAAKSGFSWLDKYRRLKGGQNDGAT